MIAVDPGATKRVGVVFGGWSHEANYSAAPHVADSLKRLGFDARSIDYRSPSFLSEVSEVDVVFPQTLGAFGEDGTLQGLLDYLRLRYVGCGVAPSAICANKYLCSSFVRASAIRHGGRDAAGMWAPDNTLIFGQVSAEQYDAIALNLSTPFVIKPLVCGASFGVKVIEDCKTFLAYGQSALKEFGCLLAEEFVVGTECTVGMIEDSQSTIELPAKLIKRTCSIHSQKEKLQSDDSVAALSPAMSERISAVNRVVFEDIGARGLWRIDLIFNEEGCCYVIDVNTIPGLIPGLSSFPQMCRTVGIEYDAMILMLVGSAYRSPRMQARRLLDVPPIPKELQILYEQRFEN